MMGWRIYGAPPSEVAVLHGGPGGAGEVEPLAAELGRRGHQVLEPFQTARSVDGQVEELAAQIEAVCAPPVAVVGWSWGAWLGSLLSARHPALVRSLVLVGSGPFEAADAAVISVTKRARLTAAERAELAGLDPWHGDGDRFIELSDRAETWDRDGSPRPAVAFDRAVHEAVWAEAKAMRESGALLREVAAIRCSVLALHGDQDPRPARGVEEPLSRVLPQARFVLLERCGHKPWQEVHARDRFFDLLEGAL